MSKEKQTQVEFTLKDPIEYHSSGKLATASSLTLLAPSNAQRVYTTRIKNIFFKALKSHTKDARPDLASEDENPDQELTPSELLAMIYMADVDVEAFEAAFKSLITSPGVCKVNNEVFLTAALYDKLSDADTDELVGTYLLSFFIGSAMDNLNKK